MAKITETVETMLAQFNRARFHNAIAEALDVRLGRVHGLVGVVVTDPERAIAFKYLRRGRGIRSGFVLTIRYDGASDLYDVTAEDHDGCTVTASKCTEGVAVGELLDHPQLFVETK
jgi:hypothetical protein